MDQSNPFEAFTQALANHQQAAMNTSAWDDVLNIKQQQVAQASQAKIDELRKKQEIRENSWVGKLGLDPNTLDGGTVNLAASVVASGSEALGHIASMPINLAIMASDANIPQYAFDAYARYKRNEATPEDIQLLNSPAELVNEAALRDGYVPQSAAAVERAKKQMTLLEQFQMVDDARKTAQSITDTMNIRHIIDSTARDKLSLELRMEGADGIALLNQASQEYENGEVFAAAKTFAKGLANLAATGGSAFLNNKQAFLEYASEMIPDLILGYIKYPALVVRNLGYGFDAYNQGIENYRKDNNGQMPSEDERAWMAANAFGMALADTLGDTSILKAITRPGRPVEGVKGSVGRVASATAGGTTVEGATEGIQTYMEGEARYRPATGLDIFEGTTIGAGAGGITVGAGKAGAELLGVSQEQQQIKREAEAKETSIDARIAKAIAEGQYETLTNPELNKDLPLDRVAVALYKDATREDATPEQKTASTQALSELQARLQEELSILEVEERDLNPENLKDDIRKLDLLIAKMREAEDPNVADILNIRKNTVNRLRDLNALPKEERQARQKRITELRNTLEMVSQGVQRIKEPEVVEQGNTVLQQALDTSADSAVRSEAAQQVITLAMEMPEFLDSDAAIELANDSSLELSEDQRSFLRYLSDAAVAKNELATMESVHRDIFSDKARDGFFSLPQYQAAVTSAIRSGKLDSAKGYMENLKAFVQSHKGKAQLARQALKQVTSGKQWAIWNDPTSDLGWRLMPHQKKDDAKLRRNGGLSFSTGQKSKELVAAIEAEAKAIEATYNQLSAALKLARLKAPSTQQTQTTQTTQQSASASVKQPTTPVQDDPAAPARNSAFISEEESLDALADRIAAEQDEAAQSMDQTHQASPAGVETVKRYSPEMLRANPDKVYVFGDNLIGKGKKGQAIIRDEPNAIGIPTKRLPSMDDNAFFGQNIEEEKAAITKAINKIIEAKNQGKTIVMPEDGIGTGLADLENRAPEVFAHLQAELQRAGLIPSTTPEGNVEEDLDTADDTETQVTSSDSRPRDRNLPSNSGVVKALRDRVSRLQLLDRKITKARNQNIVLIGTHAEQNKAYTGIRNAARYLLNQNTSPAVRELAESLVNMDWSTVEPNQVIDSVVPLINALTEGENATRDLFAPDTVLTVFAEPHEKLTGNLGDRFQKVNLVQGFYKQVKGKEGSTLRPLASERNFLTSVLLPGYSLDSFIPAAKTKEVQENRTRLFQKFAEKAQVWNKTVLESFKPKDNSNFRYEDFMQYFYINGEIDENVLTAVSAAAFTWLIENDRFYNSEDTVRGILGLDEHEAIPRGAWKIFGRGNRESIVQNELGKRVVQALGLVPHSKNIPANVQALFESSMGAHALNLLIKQGFVEKYPVSREWFVEEDPGALSKKKAANKSVAPYHWFVRIKRNTVNGRLQNTPEFQELLEVSRNTQGGLNALFGVETTKKGPTFSKPEKKLTTNPKTGQPLPKEQADTLFNYSQRPWQLIQDYVGLKGFSDSALRKMFGIRDLDSMKVQAGRRESLEAINESIERSLKSYFEFLDSADFRNDDGTVDYSKEFYFNWIQMSQQRARIDSNTITPQENKLHRFLVRMPEWTQTVDLNDPDSDSVRNFKLAVLEGFGEKTDKQSNTTSLPAFDAWLEKPVIQAAIPAALKLLRNELLSDVEQDALAEAVLAGGEGAHSLAAVVHLAKYHQALTSDSKVFESNLIREGDGINNGPILALLQSGAWTTPEQAIEFANRGGIFTKGSKHKNFGPWKEQTGKTDLYETLALGIHQAAQRVLQDASPKILNIYNAIFEIIGPFYDSETGKVTGRNTVKTPLTAMMFGSGISKAIHGMGQELIDTFYEKVEDLLNKPESEITEEQRLSEIQALVQAIQRLIPSKDLSAYHTLEGAQNLVFTPKEREMIVKTFEKTLGKQVETALNAQFKAFLDFRNTMNRVTNLAFGMYKAVYDYEYRKFVKELMQNGTLATITKNGVKVAIEDLSQEQKNELAKRVSDIFPLVHTAMSKDSGELRAGLPMLKTERMLAGEELLNYTTNVTFAKPHPVANPSEVLGLPPTKQTNFRAVRGMTGHGMVTSEVSPGVRTFIMMIHALDSSIITRVYAQYPGLNIHDALGIIANRLEEAMQKMNEHTFDNLLNFSLPEEIMKGVFRVYDGFAERKEAMMADPEFAQAVEVLEADGPIHNQLTEALLKANTAERHKLELLANVQYVNQYGVENGEYTVTPEDLERVAERSRTSVLDRVLEARTKNKPGGVIAANLSKWVIEAKEKARQAIAKGRPLSAMDREWLDIQQKVVNAFIATGDIDKALLRVFPPKPGKVGDIHAAFRDRWRQYIRARLVQGKAPVRDIREAPINRVMDLLTIGKDSLDLPEGLRKDLRDVFVTYASMAETMVLAELDKAPASIEEAVYRTLKDADRAEAVLGFLSRKYNQRQTVWGTLGKPRVESDPILVEGFKKKRTLKFGEVLDLLRQSWAAEPKERRRTGAVGFQVQLLAEIKKHLDPNLEFVYVDQDTPSFLAPEGVSVTNAKGWTDFLPDGKSRIMVKGTDFIESNLNRELLIHEMLHVVTQDKLSNNRIPAVRNLKKILAEVQTYVQGNPALASRYSQVVLNRNADGTFDNVRNLNELVVWGMTNAGFQSVLKNIEITSPMEKVKNALKAFVSGLTKLIFGETATVSQTNGMYLLITNVSALLESQAKSKAEVQAKTLKQEEADPLDQISQFTTQQIYDALRGEQPLDRETDQRLKSLLDTVVNRVHGPFGAWKQDMGIMTAEDVYTWAKNTNQLPFASEANGVFTLTDQQAFVLEQVELSLAAAMQSDTAAYRDLVRTFRDARNKLKPESFFEGDWSQASVEQKEAAKAKYDFLFNLQQKQGTERTDHLSRFAAAALVIPDIYNKLNQPVTNSTTESSQFKLGEMLKSWFDRTMRMFADLVNKTHTGQATNSRIQALSERLAVLEAQRKADIARQSVTVLDQIEEAGSQVAEATKKRLAEFGDKLSEHSNGYVAATGTLVSTIAENRINELMDALEQYRAYMFKTRQGLIASMISEIRGATPETEVFHKLLRMAGQIERDRKQISSNVKKDVENRFLTKLTKEDSEAITRTVLRTDMASLLPHYTQEELTQLLENPNTLNQAISHWENKVEALGSRANHYLAYSKLLGYFMATGKARGPHLALNAYNIARGFGTDNILMDKKAIAEAEAVIDPLVSLYALHYTALSEKFRTAQRMRQETPRGNESAMLYVMKFHERLKQEALETVFEGDKTNFIKGYTRELFNPYREITITDEESGKELQERGWIKQPKPVQNDPAISDHTTKFIYLLPHGGLNTYAAGAISLTGKRRKGSAIHGGEYLPGTNEIHRKNQMENRRVFQRNLNKVKSFGNKGKNVNPESIKENFTVPVFNNRGESVNYRYMMSEQNKDQLLQRNNRLEDVLGSMASHTFDKAKAEDHNRTVIQGLKDFYDQQKGRLGASFIEVGPNSSDPEARETYQLLPPATKKAILDIWGTNKVFVRADLFDLVFGYRKLSVSTLFDRPEIHNKAMKAIATAFVDLMESRHFKLGKSAQVRVRQFEAGWQEIVKEIKDAWVIKSLTTLLSNVSSNLTILLWNGMNPKKVVETHKTAFVGLLQYQEDTDELMRLEREKSLGLNPNPKELDQRILELRDSLDRNPVKVLIDEGMFQTILEDVDTENDEYSFKSQLVERLDEATSQVPQRIKTAAKWMYMAHDTPLYKLLFKGTQMSDFIARYSLYQHLTTRKRNPLDHASAIQRISDTFVNYDIPTHRILQYLNDMGLVFFTKYYLRIQKVLMTLFQEKPVQGLLMAAAESYVSGLDTVLDSSPRLSNPFDAGALEYPNALGEILPIKAALGLLR